MGHPGVLEKLHTGLLDEPGMTSMAAALADRLQPPFIVYLQGELGAGKTTFTRAVLRQCGYLGRVKSPTYGILERYSLKAFDLVHLDLYRIAETGELEFLGLDDLHGSQSVFFIEWPERGGSRLPAPDLTILFTHAEAGRELNVICHSKQALEICKNLSKYFQ